MSTLDKILTVERKAVNTKLKQNVSSGSLRKTSMLYFILLMKDDLSMIA